MALQDHAKLQKATHGREMRQEKIKQWFCHFKHDFHPRTFFCYFCHILCYHCHVFCSTNIFCYFCDTFCYFCYVLCSTTFFATSKLFSLVRSRFLFHKLFQLTRSRWKSADHQVNISWRNTLLYMSTTYASSN